MPSIVEDQTFPSLQAFKTALREWAIERNFTPHILDSDSHRVRAGCRSSPNCPFRIRCNYNEKRGTARVTTVEDVHNCVSTNDNLAHQDIKRAETGRMKFLVEAVPKLMTVGVTTPTSQIIDAIEKRYGQRIPVRQAQKVKRALAGRLHGPCRYCRIGQHNRRNCPVRKEREAAGIFEPPTPPPQEAQEAAANNPNEDEEGYLDMGWASLAGDERRCTLCFQPGHNRVNCPKGNQSNSDSNVQSGQAGSTNSQPPGYLIPFSTPDSDSPSNGVLRQSQSAQSNGTPHGPSQSSGAAMTTPASQQTGQNGQTPRTPKEVQKEAARLMQQAARLMNEAAKMNAEAARLTASINVS